MLAKRFLAMLVLSAALMVSCGSEDDTIITDSDTIAPEAITDLAAGDPDGSSIALIWTSPGDDPDVGKARTYDIRYATFMITDVNWSTATQVIDEPPPKAVGNLDTFTVSGLSPATTYYFGIKTADEAANWSELSNIASATTLQAGNWTIYTTANSGLPSNTIQCIALEGLVKYFGTSAGLARYYGTGWTVYTTANSNIVGDNITTVAVDSAAVKWIGSDADGVSKLEGSVFTSLTTANSDLASNGIRCIVTLHPGDIWFGTGSAGISRLHDTTWTQYNTSTTNLIFNAINTMAFDNDGNLWVATNLGGVARLDNDSFVNYPEIAGYSYNGVHAIASDDQGNIWFGTDHGVAVFDGSSWTTYNTTNSGLLDDVVTSIAVGADGDMWFGGYENGLSRFDGTAWTPYTTGNSRLPDNFVLSLQVDPLGNLWIGTLNGLAMFYD